MNVMLSQVMLIAMFLGIIVVYLLPTVIAVRRRHERATIICILNVLLGWTVVVWAFALGWALMGRGGTAGATAAK